MIAPKNYVHSDDHGVLRVGATRVSLDSVVYAFQQGHSAETIREQYPALSLEEVYGAIAFYLANQEEVHQYLERQQQTWDELRRRAEQNPSPVVERLRALRAGSPQEKR
jgi:uncharacterized protein (DUF433 family)